MFTCKPRKYKRMDENAVIDVETQVGFRFECLAQSGASLAIYFPEHETPSHIFGGLAEMFWNALVEASRSSIVLDTLEQLADKDNYAVDVPVNIHIDKERIGWWGSGPHVHPWNFAEEALKKLKEETNE